VRPIAILHCHSTFSLGGKEARAVRLMNVFGAEAEHTILSSVPEAIGARDAIESAIIAHFPGDSAPALYGKPSPARYRALTRYMKQFDLVLTYNWGSMDAVGARRLLPFGCPPLIHHEDGFNADEVERLNWKRNAFRQMMLPTARAVVVPSERLEQIARDVWKQPATRITRIPNGIDASAYEKSAPRLLGTWSPQPGQVVVGTIAGLREVKNLPRLVRAVAAAGPHVALVIAGEGPERAAIVAQAAALGIADRVHLPGFVAEPEKIVGLFDIFALSSNSEQFPISVLEAMAGSLPIVSTDVGDVRQMVAPANQPYLMAPEDEAGLAFALGRLAADQNLRAQIGVANRARVVSVYGETAMISAYRNLYFETAKTARNLR
jgi:L-malate glycosyltransferase